MAINKVEFDGQTLIDLTGDTVTQQDVLNGKSFHSADGVQRSGTATIPVSDVTVDGTSVVTNGVAEVVTDNLAPTVTEASSRTNLAVGDSLKTIIGKIKKFFSDLKTVAFTGAYSDLSGTPTNLNQFTNGPGYITSSGSCASATTASKIDNIEFENNNSTGKNANDVTYNGHTYYTSNGPSTSLGASVNDGALYTQAYSDKWVAQIAQDYRNGRLFVRGKNNNTWQSWKRIANYDEIPTNTNQLTNGAGFITASGTAANVSGTVAIANGGTGATSRLAALKNLTNEDVGTSSQYFLTITNSWGKGGYCSVANAKSVLGLKSAAYTESSAYAASGHNHDSTYLKLSGGSMTGKIYSSAARKLQWTTSDSDNNPDGASWYGLGTFTPSGDYAWICLSNYWGVSLRARDAAHIKANGYAIMTVAGGSFIDNISITNGKYIRLYNAANNNFTELSNSSNGTGMIKSGYGWLNLCTNNQVQCRNTGDTAWVNIAAANISSSRRFKENIKDLTEEDAKKLLDVRTVTFDFKEKYSPSSDWEHERFNQPGVIAEEVLDIYPTLVRFSNYEDQNEDPIPTFVEYSHFVPYLIKMVQMQQKEIDQLKAEVAELKL